MCRVRYIYVGRLAAELLASWKNGHVAELVDALDLGSSGATRQSSSLCLPRRLLRWSAARK
jgi:hypothetical protein